MNAFSHGLKYRLGYSIFAAALMSPSVREYLATGKIGTLATAFGFLLWGVTWFLRPVVFGGSMRQTLHRTASYAIEWKNLAAICQTGGLIFLWIGLVLKYASPA